MLEFYFPRKGLKQVNKKWDEIKEKMLEFYFPRKGLKRVILYVNSPLYGAVRILFP
ncbi:hypothetical protein TCEL_02290 [Thermobrachium celere DSM 8682]|uniref:Uncharacterized protein n=1 Tax=Thermobrachium celere DSM 8682 TaxID=941824 RepID=R7RSP5_9CLOT|nr:hypothetical protein TCEL_02290 [Thermobrachium celere DSM 8682]